MIINKYIKILTETLLFIALFIFGPSLCNALEFSTDNILIHPYVNENTYEITIPSDTCEINLKSDQEDLVWSSGLGKVVLEAGKEHTIILQDSSGNIEVYLLYPNRDIARIKSVSFTEKVLKYEFNTYKYNYKLDVNNKINDLTLNVIPEDGVTYNIIKPSKLDVGANIIRVEASKVGAVSTTYTFNVFRKERFVSKGFSFTGEVQEFTAPVSGTYKLEVWGAEGGYAYNSVGGKGGYAKGYYDLEEGETIYVHVGGAGTTSTVNHDGGYNGGGAARIGSRRQQAGSGGGASDIRTQEGPWYNDQGLLSRLIVAGGGGGASIHYQYTTSGSFAGGAGGGDNGINGITAASGNPAGTGGSQTGAGQASGQSSTRGGFGYGGVGKSATSSASGGGGGWYGGGGSYCAGAGGGSGYIGGVTAYKEDSAITIAGNLSIPTYDSTGTMTGNSGNGYAKITIMGDDATPDLDELTLISVDKDGMMPEFDPLIKEYYLELESTDTKIEISAKTLKGEALIIGTGIFDVLSGDTVFPIVFTNTDGTIETYNLNVTRALNPSAYLKGYKVNGTYYDAPTESEDPNKIVYNITVPYDTVKINLELIKLFPGQKIPEDTVYDFPDSSLTKTIAVESEGNVSNQIYEFNFIREKTTLLKSLNITGGKILSDFDPKTTEYDLEMSASGRVLNMDATAWFPEAKITYSEPRYVGVNDKLVTIKVELDDVAPTTYRFNIKRLSKIPDDIGVNYTCTEEYKEYEAVYSGLYKLEVWGAEGAGVYYSQGGKGGYAKGYYYLNAGDKLYVYVGCKGISASQNMPGGYNGGGASRIGGSGQPAGSGGGATDIRLVNGEWNNYDSLASRLIVAGGGGGASVHYGMTNKNFSGGAGGGLNGINGITAASGNPPGTGGSQTGAGQASGQSSTRGGFGYGGVGKAATSSASGGGGGWYGGGGSYCAGAGGGSSYIGGVTSYGTENPIVIAGNASMPTYDGANIMIGNSGDGYAKIKRVSAEEGDTFLDKIILNDGNIKFDFEPWTLEYNINLDKTYSKIKIDAITKDVTSKVKGIGNFSLNPGVNKFELIVTATDGSTKTYKININKEADDDASPLNILVKNSHSYLCNKDEGTCIYKFNPNELEYSIKVPYQTEKITLQTILRNTNQKVEYKLISDGNPVSVTDPTFMLTNMTTNIEVTVIAEDGVTERTYTYEFIRDDRGNNNLASLKVINPTGILLDKTFNAQIYEYSVIVPSDTENIEVEAIADNPAATIEIKGDKNLITGLNDVLVVVTSENNLKRTYLIHVYKEKENNIFLEKLNVYDIDNNEIELTPIFNKLITSYTANIPSTTDKIRIDASTMDGTLNINPISSEIKLNESGYYTLVSGTNIFELVVTSDTGDVQVYSLNIVKQKNNNTNILNIELEGYSLDPIFDKDTLYYTVEIPSNVNALNVNVTTEEATTTYTVSGNNKLNNNVNTIVVTGIAEDKTYKVYEITVVKELSTNNYLQDIQIDGVSIDDFDKTEENYSISLSNVNMIEVKGITEDITASVSGNGKYALAKGVPTVITLDVMSEDGSKKSYVLTITRDVSDDVSLKEVNNNRGSAVSKVQNETYDYLINVQYEVKSIEITGIPNDKNSLVVGNKIYNLVPGINDITLRVTAESGNYKDYVVRIKRDLSNNDDLDFLYVKEGGLNPNFNETTIMYDVLVPNNVIDASNLHIEWITEDKDATVEVIGATGALEVGNSKEIKVMVTAPNKIDTKVYTLNVTRQEATTENLSLLKLETNRGELIPTFNPDTLNYELSVENDIIDINILASAMSDDVKIVGTGNYNLKVGKNAISVFVIGNDGVQRDYQIVVTRKKSNDATLKNLVVKGHTLSPSFTSDNENYSITTSLNEIEFTSIIPTEDDATYTVLNNSNLATGSIINIVVTAPDGETTKTYNISVSKVQSNNNNLKSLEVEGYVLKPVFHKGVTFYAVEVSNDTNSIIINAIPEDELSTINGDGLKIIKSGENYFDITVTSEAGTTKIYKILVTKEASDNNYLASLYSLVGTWNKSFVKVDNDYVIRVPNEVDEIELFGTLEDESGSVSGLGSHKLNVGDNNITVIVTSESGIINTYSINVIRDVYHSSYLKALSVKGYSLDQTFNKELFEYFITVNNETTFLDLSYTKEDNDALVTVLGNENFDIGMNEVHIKVKKVVSEDETLESEYILYVNREMSTNNFLSSIIVSEGELNEPFNKEILEYTVEVDRNIDKINIDAIREDLASTITTKLGDYSLELGNNVIPIKVKSSIGITRTYILNVIRKKGTNNYLSSLNVNHNGNVLELTPAFDKTINNYDLNVENDILFIEINAMAEDSNATIIGDGIKTLRTGINSFEIIVTSEEGIFNKYTLNVTREVSCNNYLTDLVPSSGTLEPEFNKEILEYTLLLDSTVEQLGFAFSLESNLSSVSGIEKLGVSEGETIRNIIVTAENGDVRTYKIKVLKKSESEARLESLIVDNYSFEFDPDTFSYNIKVSKSKKKLLESEITAIAKDPDATVNLMGDLDLVDGIINIYTIEVIAKDGYTTQEYTLNITRDSDEYTIRSNKYEIVRFDSETDEDYVIGIEPSTIISDFKNNFENPPEDLKVYLETTESSDSDLTATALILKLEKNGHVYDTLRVIVRGDITKDGKVNITDQVKMINYVGRTTTLDKYQMLAADLTFDGKVNITDQVKIINYVGRKISDLNSKPTS